MIATLAEIPALTQGAHGDRGSGVCLLEAVAWLAGEDHTDEPVCVSLVLASFGRALNDALLPGRADLEPRLRALAPRLLQTAGHPDLDQRAGLMAADWICRVYTPTWLSLAGLDDEARALRESPPVDSWDALPQAALNRAKDRSDAAWAARTAAWAARTAAWAARTAAWAAARAAARAAAWGAAWGAAGDATRDALQPTVDRLQEDALELFERMIALYEVSP